MLKNGDFRMKRAANIRSTPSTATPTSDQFCDAGAPCTVLEMIREVSTIFVRVAAITDSARDSAITFDQVGPPSTSATYTSAEVEWAWSLAGDTTPCSPSCDTE